MQELASATAHAQQTEALLERARSAKSQLETEYQQTLEQRVGGVLWRAALCCMGLCCVELLLMGM
jgi:hypothetical protein